MRSEASTVNEYLAALPPDRRTAILAVRQVILENLDPTFVECMQYGMIGYVVPHSVYPDGYHCDPRQPLTYLALASQKNYMSVYMMAIYASEADENWFRKAWTATGRKLDAGKSCVRFRTLDDVALDVIAEAIRRWPAQQFIAHYEQFLKHARKRAESKPSPSKANSPPTKAASKRAAPQKTTPRQATPQKTAKQAAAPRKTTKKAPTKQSPSKKRAK